MNAIRVAKMIEKYDPYWFEEPCPPDNIDAIREVREATTIPVVTGEALYTRNDFREVLVKRAADIINPDICNTGGILELTQIAAMAQPFYVGVSPHGWNSTSVGCAAAVHASAVMPNFLIYEYAISVEPMSRGRLRRVPRTGFQLYRTAKTARPRRGDQRREAGEVPIQAIPEALNSNSGRRTRLALRTFE